MATTVTDILTAAFAKSTKNVPSRITSETTDLCGVVTRSLRGVFAVGARVNPVFYGTQATVVFSAPGWARPVDAESVFRLELLTGAEVALVPFDQRQAELALPSVYAMGQVYRSAGNPSDPTSGSLVVFYAKRATAVTGLTDTLDALWPEAYNELLVLDVALYLALKDGRADEVGTLKLERDRWLSLYVAFLEHANANERRMFGSVRYINTNSLVSLTDLLAGGSMQAAA